MTGATAILISSGTPGLVDETEESLKEKIERFETIGIGFMDMTVGLGEKKARWDSLDSMKIFEPLEAEVSENDDTSMD